MPSGKKVVYGVWEDARFIGVVIFSRGPGPQIGRPFGLEQTAVCELSRIALRDHKTPVTRVVSIALRLLRKLCPGLRAVVSFADPEQGRHGGIYQAGNWYFIGVSHSLAHYVVGGTEVHNRAVMEAIRPMRRAGDSRPMIETVREYYRGSEVVERRNTPRYKYVYPLDEQLRVMLEGMRKQPPDRLVAPVVGKQTATRCRIPNAAEA